jgi:TolB-like protein/Tfp pilus assembly protein PilF
MEALASIFEWLREQEAGFSAVAAILVIAGVVFAGFRWLLRRPGKPATEKNTGSRAEASLEADSSPADLDPLTVPGFEGRPAIAVLPFDDLSSERDQEYFADGIAEDLITRLSAWRSFPVIARNSSFTYKGKPVDVKRVSRELGVRYVVEGSVRRSEGRVRIAAQLVDATSGHHVWAETYDRELREIFTLQDEITEAVVASMYPQLTHYESERAVRQEPQDLGAWELAQRGWWHYNRLSREDNRKGLSFIGRAIELNPNFVWAYFALAMTHYSEIFFAWTDDVAQSIAAITQAAGKAVSLDDEDPCAQIALVMAYSLTGQRDKMVAAGELAVQLAPTSSLAQYCLGLVVAMTGSPDAGVASIEKAIRLSPRDTWMFEFLSVAATAHFAAARYEEAVELARQSLQRKPDYPWPLDILAASLVHLGRVDEARSTVEGMLRTTPDHSIATLRLVFQAADADLLQRLFDGLRKAGLPE